MNGFAVPTEECDECGSGGVRVIDGDYGPESATERWECPDCGARFTLVLYADPVKDDQHFDA